MLPGMGSGPAAVPPVLVQGQAAGGRRGEEGSCASSVSSRGRPLNRGDRPFTGLVQGLSQGLSQGLGQGFGQGLGQGSGRVFVRVRAGLSARACPALPGSSMEHRAPASVPRAGRLPVPRGPRPAPAAGGTAPSGVSSRKRARLARRAKSRPARRGGLGRPAAGWEQRPVCAAASFLPSRFVLASWSRLCAMGVGEAGGAAAARFKGRRIVVRWRRLPPLFVAARPVASLGLRLSSLAGSPALSSSGPFGPCPLPGHSALCLFSGPSGPERPC